MDFYYSFTSAPCRSVQMAAKAIGLEMNKILLRLSDGEHLKPEFLKLNPQHTVPTLVDNGFVLWESRAILIYLVEKYALTDTLYPKCPQKRALVNQRLFFDMGTLYKSFIDYYYPHIKFRLPCDPEKFKQIEHAFEYLDIFLKDQKYVAVADTLTIADIAILATVSTFAIADFDFSKWKNVTRWYENAKLVTPGFEENWEGCLEARKKYGFVQN